MNKSKPEINVLDDCCDGYDIPLPGEPLNAKKIKPDIFYLEDCNDGDGETPPGVQEFQVTIRRP